MEVLLSLLLGMCLMALVKKDGINITIKHEYIKNDSIVEVPEMSDVLKEQHNKEDDVYKGMGDLLDDINRLMVGGNTRGKE